MAFRYYLLNEDYSLTGFDDEDLAFKIADSSLVLDAQTGRVLRHWDEESQSYKDKPVQAMTDESKADWNYAFAQEAEAVAEQSPLFVDGDGSTR